MEKSNGSPVERPMTPQQILAENYEQIEGICRRLPPHWACVWPEEGQFWCEKEHGIKDVAVEEGRVAQLAEALSKKQRGQRLVVIVTPSETLYRFI